MAYIQYNCNPRGKRVGDCVVRAVSRALHQSWDDTYYGICARGAELCDMPSSDYVWGEYLKAHGFRRYIVPDNFGAEYTVETFSRDHPHGTYILAITGQSGHVVCVSNGDYWDTWDSGDRVPMYYWAKERL